MPMPIYKFLFAVLLLVPAFAARAADVGGVFGQGSTQLSLLLGSGYSYNSNYLIVGAGVNYFVLDGVGVGLSYENWSGSGPGINVISPSVQYVFNRDASLQPYVGGFYRHAVVTGLPAVNSVGARAGAYFASGSRTLIGFGLAYESYLNCQTALYSSCSETYPEISILLRF